MDSITTILHDAEIAANQATSLVALGEIRTNFLGKKGKLTELLKQLGTLPIEQRPAFGQVVNTTKTKILEIIQKREEILKDAELISAINQDSIDVTLPGRGFESGSIHPITKVCWIFTDFFSRMGFNIYAGPEIETDYYNFSALNFPPHHPAKTMQDTFYFSDGLLLRTHTTPVQVRAMQTLKPPFRILVPGRVYRCDSDATHSPMFNQVEGLIIDEKITFANLKWMLYKFLEYFFQSKVITRFRPGYFPFTEPSAELDIEWTVDGKKRWLEVLGCGMVHPKVLQNCGIDSDRYTGCAFGGGLDRYAMLRYGINDIKLLFENDLQFLRQF